MRISDWSSDVCSSDLADQVGCVRAFRLKDGGFIREKLLALSDYDFSCSYSILESPMGVENYVATLKLTPVTDGDRTFAEWSASFDCAVEREAELTASIGGTVFQGGRSEEHTSELQSLMRISYAVFCLKKKNSNHTT